METYNDHKVNFKIVWMLPDMGSMLYNLLQKKYWLTAFKNDDQQETFQFFHNSSLQPVFFEALEGCGR